MMALVFSEPSLCDLLSKKFTDGGKDQELDFLNEPTLIQNYVNHGAKVFKVFVIGEKSFVFSRPSLRNIVANPSEKSDGYFVFNSQNELPSSLKPPEDSDPMPGEALLAPSQQIVEQLTQSLSSVLGLKLLGYDIITDIDNTNKHYVIDANYLPSYRGLTNANHFILEYLISLAGKRENTASNKLH